MIPRTNHKTGDHYAASSARWLYFERGLKNVDICESFIGYLEYAALLVMSSLSYASPRAVASYYTLWELVIMA